MFTGNCIATEDGFEHELLSEAETAWAQREWSIQHVLFPSMRLFLKPPNSMAVNGTFVRVGRFYSQQVLIIYAEFILNGSPMEFLPFLRI